VGPGGKVTFNTVHEGITRSLLGKSVKQMLPETLLLNEKMMVDINFERYDPKTRTPYSSIAYNPAENAFFHPWSTEQVGEYFGYHKLGELMTPKDYLEMPSAVVDEFLEAVSKGLNKRDKAEEARRKAEEQRQGLPKEQQEDLRKAGFDPRLVKPR